MEETSELVLDFKMKGVPGVPIPPSRVVAMTSDIDKKKKRLAYQEGTWKCLATVIDDLVGSLSATNVCSVAASVFAENLIRGKGLFCASCMKHQMLSPQNTDVIAVLVFIINAHIPLIGFILLRRLMFTFNLARLSRNMMKELRAVTKFMVHLSNKKIIDYHITKDLFLYLLNDGAEDYVLVAAELFKELDLSFESHHFMDDRPIKRRFKGVHRYFVKEFHKGQLGTMLNT